MIRVSNRHELVNSTQQWLARPVNALLAFRAVAQARSFTRAAARIGVSPSALSHTMRALEERLGVRLLTRATRSVVPSEAGERLLSAIGPHFDGIEVELAALSELRDKPAGALRITTGIHAAQAIVWPAVAKLLPVHPDIQVEISVHSGFIDIVEERFDAGVRLGETIAQDMVAVRIGPDMRMAAVASPGYFSARKPPRAPPDLALHNCINLRFPTRGGLYAWEFEKAGRALNVRVEGQFVVNDIALALQPNLSTAWASPIYPRTTCGAEIEGRRLTRVLESWCPHFPRLSSLLPEPATSIARLHAFSGGAPLPSLMHVLCRPATREFGPRYVRLTSIRDGYVRLVCANTGHYPRARRMSPIDPFTTFRASSSTRPTRREQPAMSEARMAARRRLRPSGTSNIASISPAIRPCAGRRDWRSSSAP